LVATAATNNLVYIRLSMKILIMANYSNSTGYAWKNIYRLFEIIGDRVHNECGGKVFISFPVIEYASKLIMLEKFDGVAPLDPRPRSIPGIIHLLKYIIRNRIKYVYLTDKGCTHFIYALMRFAGVRKIIIHSRVSVQSPHPAIEQQYVKLLMKLLYRRLPLFNADKIYTVSNFVRDRLIFKAGIKEKRVVTIMNGINTSRFDRKYDNPYPPEDSNIKIFACGRISPEKGFQYLIKAVALINAEPVRKCSLYIAGNGHYLETLIKLLKELGIEKHAHLLGEIKDVTDYQMHADINVVPSIWGDACPSSITEALCAHRPLICTQAGGIPEMITTIKGDHAATLIPPSDACALAHAIRKVIANPEVYARMAQEGYQHAMSNLSEDAYYSRFFRIFLKDIGCN
jgi:glycosyltransferase involved in cell wall biosynthesis